MKRLILILLLLLSAPSFADETGIVATVGDLAITSQDLISRTKLIIISSGLKADDETARKIAPQILQSLINESLQLHEGEKLQIQVTDDEMNKAITGIEAQNKMEPGNLKAILKKAGVPYSSLQQQVKAQLTWAKIRAKRIQPRIIVTDEAVDDYVKTQNMNPMQVEYFVNEIVLPVETAKEDKKVHDLGNKLVSELNKGGDFKKIAKEFSQAASGQTGGEVGWLAENQIPKELLAEVKKIGPNKIIGPVKSIEGYFILLVKEARSVDPSAIENSVSLKHFELPYKNEKELDAAAEKLLQTNDPIKGCKEAGEYAKKMGVIMQDYGMLQVKELQPQVRKLIVDLPVGRYSSPLNTGNSMVTFLVCSRTDKSKVPNDVQRDKAREILFKRKVELESRAYLSNMRRNANIDIKIQ